ncbi:unnamed protein product [Darwinula stevensoni]|uniref:RRM domain-containing protein n=1 Tax=Darwinula stevensoni TaxID=69355 RepID=A0A7R8X305_9CRUS|nr:unnamed protein product [Darwinula stevensoni]CAG0882002.1 unnamed protein product [Darwinula stevensoni]
MLTSFMMKVRKITSKSGSSKEIKKKKKNEAEKKLMLEKREKQNIYKDHPEKKSSIVYLSHIPHGFYEEEMRKFFSQFGKVRRISLARSKKTGESRGFAFIQFQFPEVASIVAETMNNYLMFKKLLKCKVVPPEKLKPGMFQTPGSMKRMQRLQRLQAQHEGKESARKVQAKAKARLRKLKKQSKKLGITLDGVVDQSEKGTKTEMEEELPESKDDDGVQVSMNKKKKRKEAHVQLDSHISVKLKHMLEDDEQLSSEDEDEGDLTSEASSVEFQEDSIPQKQKHRYFTSKLDEEMELTDESDNEDEDEEVEPSSTATLKPQPKLKSSPFIASAAEKAAGVRRKVDDRFLSHQNVMKVNKKRGGRSPLDQPSPGNKRAKRAPRAKKQKKKDNPVT